MDCNEGFEPEIIDAPKELASKNSFKGSMRGEGACANIFAQLSDIQGKCICAFGKDPYVINVCTTLVIQSVLF